MSRIFVGVGGTGQHTALALADYLVLAHSVTSEALPPVEFILLDSDSTASEKGASSAWDLCTRQLGVLKRYPDRAAGSPNMTTEPPYPALPPGANTADHAINRLLENDEAAPLFLSPSQLPTEVTKGYFGEPRIAAILTDILLEKHSANTLPAQHPLRRLSTALEDANGRICISGSTVGGTGAGVLPRLVEELSAKAMPRARICALVSLDWFQLDNDGNARVSKMTANSIACLWHYVRRMQGRYRLIVWGAPRIVQTRREHNFEDRYQGVKSDLTLPIHASAAAVAFLFADEIEERHVVPVAPLDGVHLPRDLSYGAHDLNWLVERNLELIGRLELITTYVDKPFDGAVLPDIRSACRVSILDVLSSGARTSFVEKVKVLVAAKLSALKRMRDSDAMLSIPDPPRLRGIDNVRSWQPQAGVEAVTTTLTDFAELSREKSPLRLIRDTAQVSSSFEPADEGTRDGLRSGHIGGLAPFDQVEASRVPDCRAVDLILDTFFSNSHYQTPEIALSIIADHAVTPPPSLARLEADRYPSWVHRWMFLLSALVSGVARPVRLAKPVLNVTHAVFLAGRRRGEPIGYLSSELIAVPNMSAFWYDEESLQSAAHSLSPVSRLSAWLRTLRQVSTCLDAQASLPKWFAYAEMLSESDIQEGDLHAGSDTVLFRRDATGGVVPLPLPARDEGTRSNSLAEAMALAFSLPVLSLTGPDSRFTPPERAMWDELTNAAQSYHRFAGDSSEWETGSTETIVWLDLLSLPIRSALNGGIVFSPGRGFAWRRTGGGRLLLPHEVMTREIAVFTAEGERKVFTHPVRSEYIGLYRSADAHFAENGRVSASVSLLGRNDVHLVTFDASRVRTFERLTVFSWPKVPTFAHGSHSVLFRSNTGWSFRFRVFYDDDRRSTLTASPTMASETYAHYLVPSNHGVTGFAHPRLMAIKATLHPDGNDWADIGLLVYSDAASPSVGTDETWAVDLGTSSTVIARRRLREGIDIIRPSEDRDSTMVYSLGDGAERNTLCWYPTWNEKAPYTSPNQTLPTQVIDMAAVRGFKRIPVRDRIFARDFAIDHGGDLDDKGELLDAVITDLKWATGENVEYRLHYLRQTLEQAIHMEMARSREFPQRIQMVFTLPLRQLSDLGTFVTEVGSVTAGLQKKTGVVITSKFQWESLAVAPRTVEGNRMVVVADLGGGTLDLYAAYKRRDDPEVNGPRRAAESAYIGGKQAIRILRNGHALNKLTERDFLRRHHDAFELDTIANDHRPLVDYFEIIHRYIALWTAVLRVKWEVRDIPVDVRLAGLGWSLPGSAQTEARVAQQLTDAAQALGHEIDFREYGEESGDGPQSRKVYLARRTATDGGYERLELQNIARDLDMILGFEGFRGGTVLSATTDPRNLDVRQGSIEVAEPILAKLYKNTSRTLVDRLTDRLQQRVDGRDPNAGVVDGVTGRLTASALTAYAEIAVAHLVSINSESHE